MKFEKFYINWYSRAKNFCMQYVSEEEDAENIIQGVFTDMYEKWQLLAEESKLPAYLFSAIKNTSLNFLRQKLRQEKAKAQIQKDALFDLQVNYDALQELKTDFPEERDINRMLYQTIDSLPDRCREIFTMRKIDGMSQKQVAQALGISVNTIEVQMQIAYRKLREQLKDYLPLAVFLLNISNLH